MDQLLYPVHGYARPVRLTYPVGNAFAENAERRRRSDLTAYQHQMAMSRQEAAEHYHAAHHRGAAHAQPDFHANADSPRASARPVSSWSFINDNNNHNNNYQGTLEISHQTEPLLTFDPLPQTLSEFFPEELRYLADIPEDQIPSAAPDYSFLRPAFAEISQHLEMSKRDREAALLADMSPGSERERNRRALDRNHEQVQGVLRRMGYNPDRNNRQATIHSDDQVQGVLPGSYNPNNQQALDQTGDLSHEFNMSPQSKTSRSTNRNMSTPLHFNENSAEFTPHSIEHNKPTLLPPSAPSATSASRYIYRSQPASAGDDMLLVDRDMNDIHPIVRKRVGPKLPPVPRYDKETDTFDPPQPDTFIPPQRVDSLVRPDSAASEAMMPRRTPPARFAALTTQQTVAMPANLVRTYPVKNDAMVMSSGPLIPTRDGNCELLPLPPYLLIILIFPPRCSYWSAQNRRRPPHQQYDGPVGLFLACYSHSDGSVACCRCFLTFCRRFCPVFGPKHHGYAYQAR
jgi:hypothetical protein